MVTMISNSGVKISMSNRLLVTDISGSPMVGGVSRNAAKVY